MNKKEIDAAIVRSLYGNYSDEDIILLAKWLEQDENNKKEYNQLKAYLNADVTANIGNDIEHDFSILLHKIEEDTKEDNYSYSWLKIIRRTIVAVAAIAALIFFIGEYKGVKKEELYTYMSGSSVSHFVLPDSSFVTLNKNTKLTFQEDKNTRKVLLVGEAMFDVARDEKKEFIVDMNQTKVKVLGTKFSINHREDKDLLKVSLFEGSVKFESEDQIINLTPEKQITYNKKTSEIVMEKFDPELEEAWCLNIIRYRSLNIRELINLISNHYDVDILVTSLKENDHKKYTGAFDARKSIDEILDLMKKNNHLKWEKDGNNYKVYN